MKKLFYLIIINLLLIACSNSQPQYNDPIPAHDSLKIVSSVLNETRHINIWTPDSYKTGTDSLPVLYMLDGGLKEDFAHVANTLEKLINNKSIPAMILVGIENTQRRRDLTGPSEVKEDEKVAPLTDGSTPFRKFIKEELFAKINQTYRTTNKKAIIGESVAGLFVIETLLLDSDMFNAYIAFDPSVWWNNHYLVRTSKEHLKKLPNQPVKLWFAGSDATDISQYTRQLAKDFETDAPANLKWKYADEPKEQHNTIFRATKEKALIWTFGE